MRYRSSYLLPLLTLWIAACSGGDNKGSKSSSAPTIAAPPVIEAGSRVALRVLDSDGELRAGDFEWSSDPELGTIEPYEADADVVYLIAGLETDPEDEGEWSIQARLGANLSSLVLELEAQVDPVLFSATPQMPTLPGSDELLLEDAHLGWSDGVLVAAYSVQGTLAALARIDPDDEATFTHLDPAPAAPDFEAVRVLDLAVRDEGRTVYAILQEPGAALPRLTRFLYSGVLDQYSEDASFSPPPTDFLAIASDPQGRLWVAAQENDPRLWRLDDAGEIVELVIWPAGAGNDLQGMAVSSHEVVLATTGMLHSVQRADESDQRSAIVSGGNITDLTRDAAGRLWLAIEETSTQGSVRVFNAFLQEVHGMPTWKSLDGIEDYVRPLALAVENDGRLRVLDDVASDHHLARIVAQDQMATFPTERLVLDPAGGDYRVGERIQLSATLQGGGPGTIRWSTNGGTLAVTETLDGEPVTFDAPVTPATVALSASLLEQPEVSQTVYISTASLQHDLQGEVFGPGTGMDMTQARVSAGASVYHVAYQNADFGSGGAFIQRRFLDGSGPEVLTCEAGDMECSSTAFGGTTPQWINVATDVAGNAFWIHVESMDQAPILRRWRAINMVGSFASLPLPDVGGGGDGVADRFLGSIAVGAPRLMGATSSLYVVLRDAGGEDPMVVRYDLTEPLDVLGSEVVGALSSDNTQAPALAIEADGGVLVGDGSFGPVLRFTPLAEGGYDAGLLVPGFFDVPDHLGVDDGGRIYAANDFGGQTTIRIVAPTGADLGEIVRDYSSPLAGGASNMLGSVLGMAVTGDGRIRLVDDALFLVGMEQAVAVSRADPR